MHPSFYNSPAEHDTETKLTSIDFSHRVAYDSKSSWLQTLGNQCNLSIVPHTLGTLTANVTYGIILLEYVNESQVNVYLV